MSITQADRQIHLLNRSNKFLLFIVPIYTALVVRLHRSHTITQKEKQLPTSIVLLAYTKIHLNHFIVQSQSGDLIY